MLTVVGKMITSYFHPLTHTYTHNLYLSIFSHTLLHTNTHTHTHSLIICVHLTCKGKSFAVARIRFKTFVKHTKLNSHERRCCGN